MQANPNKESIHHFPRAGVQPCLGKQGSTMCNGDFGRQAPWFWMSPLPSSFPSFTCWVWWDPCAQVGSTVQTVSPPSSSCSPSPAARHPTGTREIWAQHLLCPESYTDRENWGQSPLEEPAALRQGHSFPQRRTRWVGKAAKRFSKTFG